MKETLAGRYQVEEMIGRGGMANVYRGLDTTLNRTVAIKVLSEQYTRDPAFVARFQREAQAAARLANPNVVNVFDVGADDDVHFIVMEYVQGRTLAEVLAQDGRLLPERTAEIGEHVCDALAFAHAQGIIHRDVKSANIMITNTGEVKLMDFGIARGGTDATVEQTAAVLGTPAYFSPEQARGESVDPRTDIYSLGIVLYEMLTGRVPFTADTAVAVAMAQVQEAPVPPSQVVTGVPTSLDAVIMRALAKNPANRYSSTQEMKEDLERARLGQAVAAPPVAPTQVMAGPVATSSAPLTASSSGSKWGVGLLIAGIAIAAVVLLFVLFNAGSGGGDDGSPTPSPETPTPSVVTLANLTGQTKADARRALEEDGLVASFTTETVSDPNQVDIVLSQSPEAGTELTAGDTVELTIGVAEVVSTVGVPNLFGMTESEARDALFEAGLQVGNVKQRRSNQVDPGQVWDQSPSANAEVAPDSAVGFTVSSGQEKVEVPDLTCQTITRAQDTLTGLGLVPDLDPTAAPNIACPNANHVGAQAPASGTLLEPGSTVTIQPSGP